MKERHDVVIVGAGQAGLCLSYELTNANVEHVILERGRVGQSWRTRWDSFCLVLPNWTLRLPGQPYNGPEPDGFMRRDKLVRYLEEYAASFHAPIREGTNVNSLQVSPDGSFLLDTPDGDLHAQEVVLASGAYQKPHRPTGVEDLSKLMLVLDAESYTNPDALPQGRVLVVGSGQSGCQIAEDLSLAGREVYLSCGKAPWLPRRIGDREVIEWLADTPFFDVQTEALPSPKARLNANIQLSGRDGGHDLNFRTLASMGVKLVGHFLNVREGQAHFASDLAESVAFGDARCAELCELIKKSAATKGMPAPEMSTPPPFSPSAPDAIKLDGFGAAIVTSGFRPDYTSWVRFPEAFDEMGFPIQHDGSSTVVAGLHFVGVHFLRKRASSLFLGVGEDAKVLADKLVTKLASVKTA